MYSSSSRTYFLNLKFIACSSAGSPAIQQLSTKRPVAFSVSCKYLFSSKNPSSSSTGSCVAYLAQVLHIWFHDWEAKHIDIPRGGEEGTTPK